MLSERVVPYPNDLARERVAAGIDSAERVAQLAHIDSAFYARIEAGELLPTFDELERIRAALGGIKPDRLYPFVLLATIGATELPKVDYGSLFGDLEDGGHLLVSRDEATWIARSVNPDRSVDVFVNLSCGPQRFPNISLDTVSVLRALGVDFAAGGGRLFCCGSPYRRNRDFDAAQRMQRASAGRAAAWGANLTVHLCTKCQNINGSVESRERHFSRDVPRNQQLYVFLAEVLHELGDRVPWKREVRAKILVHGLDGSPIDVQASDACARMLAMVPGVEVVGLLDDEISRIAGTLSSGLPVALPAPTRADTERRREQLAALFGARGADTMSAMHHYPHQVWSRFAGPGLAVRHPISVVAEALDCASPDRYQAACRLGDPEAILRQTRPVWRSWGLDEARARTLVRRTFDPAYAAEPARCGCGGSECRDDLIEIDVLRGTQRSVSG